MNGVSPEMVLTIIDGVMTIIARHQASGSPEPLTNQEVHAQLLRDLRDGQSAIAEEFARKGWPLPE